MITEQSVAPSSRAEKHQFTHNNLCPAEPVNQAEWLYSFNAVTGTLWPGWGCVEI